MKKNESGQALVLVLLSLSVVLTLVLYILSRSVTNIAVSGTQEASVRAFSAAEAGIEKALIAGSSWSLLGSSQDIGDSHYVANVSDFAGGLPSFNYPIPLSSGDSATIWLALRDTNGNLTNTGNFSPMKICWGDAATAPAIEVSVYYETASGNLLTNLPTIQIKRWAFDPNVGRAAGNYFTPANGTGPCNSIPGQSYAFQETLTLPSNLILAKVRMFYNNIPQNVGIDVSASGQNLPSQGQTITSTGTAGGSNRKISVFQGWPEFPFAGNAVFSPNGITK